MSDPNRSKPHRTPAETFRMARSHMGRLGLVLAILAVIALGFAPFGVHEEMFALDYAVLTVVSQWAAGLAIVGLMLGGLALLMTLAIAPRRGVIVPLLTLAISAGAIAVVQRVKAVAAADPPIHDVATDWTDPLIFGPSLTAARGAEANPTPEAPRVGIQGLDPMLEGAAVSEINARTCRHAIPVIVPGSVQAAFDKTLATLKREGLTVVTQNPSSGRIEASAVTKYLKLKGDVLARIRPEGAGARIDFRSVSRTGEIDMGENCHRIGRLRAGVSG